MGKAFGTEDTLAQESKEYLDKGIICYYGEVSTEEFNNREAIILEDLIIPEGAVFTLKGDRLQVRPKKRIIVRGKLICRGIKSEKKTRPLTITSESGPGAVDLWGGIVVEPTGKLELEAVNIYRSFCGVHIKNKKSRVYMNDLLFEENHIDFQVEDKKVDTEKLKGHNRLYWAEHIKGYFENRRLMWAILQGSTLAIGVSGLVMGALGEYKVRDYDKKYGDAKDTKSADDYYDKGIRAEKLRTAGIIVGSIGAVGFTVTIPIKIRSKRN
jgi:hypothetical protein